MAAAVQNPLAHAGAFLIPKMASQTQGSSHAPDQQREEMKASGSAPAQEILQRSDQQELGASSKNLSLDDFELIRTLGTGMLVIFILLSALAFG
jgi:hypothetical protein